MTCFPSDTENMETSRNTMQHGTKLEIPPPAVNSLTREGQEWSGKVKTVK